MPGDFDTVKERVDIVQLIGERVPLKKVGRAYSGLCPFHSEKTPSFTVDPDRRTYHCFGCARHGDIFTWLEELDGLEPVEALKILAERAGVELTSRRDPAEMEREKRFLAANDTAHFYFRQALRGTERGKEVARYIADRGIHPETVEKFGLGYAPDNWDGLVGYLRKKGYSDDEAVAAGLVGRNDRGVFDWFRDRLIVPIKDGRGRIIAFGGRAGRGSVTARTGLSVYVTVLPADTDPDVLARRDPERLRALLAEAKPVLEFVLDRIQARSDLERADGRRRFLAEALPLVAGEPDPLTRELYLGTLSSSTGLDQEALRREAAAAPPPPQRSAVPSNETPAKQTAPAERYLMALLIRFPEEAARTELAPGDLDDPDHRAMLEYLKAGKHPTSDLPAHLAAKAAALGASAPELEGEEDVAQAVEIAALGLRERNVRRRMKNAQGQLARANGGDVGAVDGEVAQLANELAELMHRRERHTVLHAADADERDE